MWYELSGLNPGETGDVEPARSAGLSDWLVRHLLPRLAVGGLRVHTPAGDVIEHRAGPGPEGVIHLHNWRAVRRLFATGGVGFAEAYMDRDWSSPDLTALLEVAAANALRLEGVLDGASWLRGVNSLRHRLSANTKRGSRRNSAAHYDLGNDFYAQWLDAGMNYSSALYAHSGESLEAAQVRKQDRAIDLLALRGGESVLEIGFGWGGLAENLLSRGAGRVTGLTLSAAQLGYAESRLAKAGLGPAADLRLQDYRDVAGRHDRIVSIEMLEAVGQEYWPTYFDRLKRRLSDNGLAVLQVITIAKAHFPSYRRGVDFIQRYIFPGGMLPTDEALRGEIARAGFDLRSRETFGRSYALTLAEWRRRFNHAWPKIEALGFDLRFRRMWNYYLSYCEAGFRTGLLDVGLYCLAPVARGRSGIGG
jgi:cyclopropane-fatty-acyl-phospholipid synthase